MKERNKQDRVQEFTNNCVGCITCCLEVLVKFINKHAYVEIALRSEPFFPSAARGFQVVTANVLRFGVLHGVSEVVFFMAQLLISIIVTYMAYSVFTFINYHRNQRNNVSLLGFLIVYLF